MVARAHGPRPQAAGTSDLVGSFGTLERELRLLCRGLACSRLRYLETVSTSVRLPDEIVQELALRWLCDDLAEEFGLTPTVRRGDDGWAVRFSRSPIVAEVESAEPARTPRGLRGVIERARVVARVLGRGIRLADQQRHAGHAPARRGAE